MSNSSDRPHKRVVVVGGGFAGAFAARYLRRKLGTRFEISLINSTNYFVFQPLLPEVASGTINAADAVTPLRLMLSGVRVRMADVIGVDLVHRTVRIIQGSKRIPQLLDYQHLVLAPGLEPSLDAVPGFAEHGLTMRNLADAFRLRNRIIHCLEHADITENRSLKARLLTLVVAGGGFSGVETMGECVEMIRRALKFYPNICMEEITPVLVQRGERLLPELPAKLGAYAQRKLEKRGVSLRLRTGIRSAAASGIELDDGSTIPASTLVTTIGSGPCALAGSLGLELVRGRIPVDRYLRVSEHENVWALGDAALIPLAEDEGGGVPYAPPTAQYAMREARCVAANVAAAAEGRELQPFHHRPRGSLASIGHYQGMGEVLGVPVYGLLAWMLWRFFYIGILPGFTTRLRVALNWLFDYFLPRNLVQLNADSNTATRFIRVAKGDVLFGPGQIVDGFYTIVDGSLESRVRDPVTGEDFVRILGAGDHWGERVISQETQTRGTLTALEDSRILVLRREDFAKLRAAMPAIDEYFKRIPEKVYPRTLRERDPPDGAT